MGSSPGAARAGRWLDGRDAPACSAGEEKSHDELGRFLRSRRSQVSTPRRGLLLRAGSPARELAISGDERMPAIGDKEGRGSRCSRALLLCPRRYSRLTSAASGIRWRGVARPPGRRSGPSLLFERSRADERATCVWQLGLPAEDRQEVADFLATSEWVRQA